MKNYSENDEFCVSWYLKEVVIFHQLKLRRFLEFIEIHEEVKRSKGTIPVKSYGSLHCENSGLGIVQLFDEFGIADLDRIHVFMLKF